MTKITREVWIDAPRQDVWDKALRRFGDISVWNPGVRASYLTSDQEEGVGATRHCDFNGISASVDERITVWEPGRRLEIDIFKGEKLPPWRNPHATFELFDEDGGTRVRATMAYEMKYGPMGSLMDNLLIKRNFAPGWSGLLAGLKHHVETGETVESSAGLPVDQVLAVA